MGAGDTALRHSGIPTPYTDTVHRATKSQLAPRVYQFMLQCSPFIHAQSRVSRDSGAGTGWLVPGCRPSKRHWRHWRPHINIICLTATAQINHYLNVYNHNRATCVRPVLTVQAISVCLVCCCVSFCMLSSLGFMAHKTVVLIKTVLMCGYDVKL